MNVTRAVSEFYKDGSLTQAEGLKALLEMVGALVLAYTRKYPRRKEEALALLELVDTISRSDSEFEDAPERDIVYATGMVLFALEAYSMTENGIGAAAALRMCLLARDERPSGAVYEDDELLAAAEQARGMGYAEVRAVVKSGRITHIAIAPWTALYQDAGAPDVASSRRKGR